MPNKKTVGWGEARTPTMADSNTAVGVPASPQPTGWTITTLGDIAIWGSGGTPSRKNPEYYDGNVPWVKTGDLGPKILTSASEFITEPAIQNSSAKYFPKGSVAIAMYGATIGKTSILGIDTTTNQACGVGQPISDCTSTEFLYYLLRNEKDNFIAKGKGGAQPNISQTLIKEHEILFPPLPEQKQIAAKLDELLAQVDSIKTRLDAIPAILKRFRQSVLAAAVSGRLTEEWRNNKELAFPDITPLDDFSEMVTKGASPKWQGINYVEDHHQTLFVTSENVGAMKLLLSSPKYVQDEFNEKQKRSILKQGDVLTNIVGASIGRAAIWDRRDKANTNQAVCIIRPVQKKCLSTYLCFYLNSPIGIDSLLGNKVDVARANISLGVIKKLKVLLPTVQEQTQITHRVEQLFAFAEQIEQRLTTARARVDHLTQSILAKAFRGELTAQWRAQHPELVSGENSAEALLARIKTERQSISPAKRPRKNGTKE